MALLPAPAALDTDGQETAEWRDAFTALLATHSPARARSRDRRTRHRRREASPATIRLRC